MSNFAESNGMGTLSGSCVLDIIGILTAIFAIIVTTLKWYNNYWQRLEVPTTPSNFLLGHAKPIITQKKTFTDFVGGYYNYYKKRGERHCGIYILTKPTYIPIDLEIVKAILQNDFEHFVDRGVYYNEEDDPLSAHLFSIEGTKWRNLRAKLTPTFTSGKMKMMFETVVKCGDQLVVEMDKDLEKQPIDVKDILGRFTADIIGNCAFGIECNSLKDPNDEFTKYFKVFFKSDLVENIRNLFTFLAPNLMRKLGIKTVKPHISKFFMSVIKDTVEYREKNNVHRNDFMHLLLQLKNRGKIDDQGSILKENHEANKDVALTFNELAAQALIFFLGGYETSSTTLSFCLFELASNAEIQNKLRKEIKDVIAKHNGQLTYDAIMEMHYMEQVINETLRKYPPIPSLFRICTKNYKVPGTNVVLKKGVTALILNHAIHHDPEYYPDPDMFDPNRFSVEEKKKRPHYSFLPFGEGPRNCIGLRFGMMQVKIGLCALLRRYNFTVNLKTMRPIQMDPQTFTLTSIGGLWLNYKKI